MRVNVAANNVAMYCANFSRVALHGMYSPQAGVVQCRNTSGTITQEDLHPFALYHIRGYVLFDDNSSSALSTIVGLTTLKAGKMLLLLATILVLIKPDAILQFRCIHVQDYNLQKHAEFKMI